MALFLTSTIVIVLLGLIPALRMAGTAKGLQPLFDVAAIQIRCSLACLIVLLCRTGRSKSAVRGNSGGRAGDCLRLRLARMSETFVNGHIALIEARKCKLYCSNIRLIAIMMFFIVRLINGRQRAATTLILLPLGLGGLYRLCVNRL